MIERKKLMTEIKGTVSKHHFDIVKKYSEENKVPFTRVVGCLIDHAIEEGLPMEYDLKLTNDDNQEYSEEGAKIISFLKKLRKYVGIDVLLAIRHDLGITKKEAINAVIGNCVDVGVLEKSPPSNRYFDYPEDYFIYGLKDEKHHGTKIKNKHRASEYDTYLKLKKKYEDEA